MPDQKDSSQQAPPRYRLEHLSIEGFKAFGHETIVSFKPITLIFGANSAGKSSIIQSLLLLHELQRAKEGVQLGDVRFTALGGDAVDLGGHPHYVHRHDATTAVILRTELTRQQQQRTAAWKTHTIFHETKIFGPSRFLPGPVNVLKRTVLDQQTLFHLAIDGEKPIRFGVFHPSDIFELHPIFNDFVTKNHNLLLDFWCNYLTHHGTNLTAANDYIRSTFEDMKTDTAAVTSFVRAQLAAVSSDRYRAGHDLGSLAPLNVAFTLEKFDAHAIHLLTTERVFSNEKLSNILPISEIAAQTVTYQPPELTQLLERIQLEWQSFAADIGTAQEAEKLFLLSLRYIGPLRSIPSRSFSSADDANLHAFDGTLAWELLTYRPGLIKLINRTLKSLQMAYALRVKQPALEYAVNQKYMDEYLDMFDDADELTLGHVIATASKLKRKLVTQTDKPRIELRDLHTDTLVSHRDVGIGVSQVLPILVSCYAETNATICIEQPELHLHPRLQGDLADVFIETAITGDQQNAYIIETHSEAIIRRLMRRVREGKISKDDISIVYVEAGPEGSTVTHIHLDDEGDLVDEWPNGFFEEGFRDNMAGR